MNYLLQGIHAVVAAAAGRLAGQCGNNPAGNKPVGHTLPPQGTYTINQQQNGSTACRLNYSMLRLKLYLHNHPEG